MLNTNTVPARNLQKAYKAIIHEVKTKKHAVVLTTNDEPQAAIVSLEDLEELNKIKARQANVRLLKLATDNKETLKELPADLREQANNILYSHHD